MRILAVDVMVGMVRFELGLEDFSSCSSVSFVLLLCGPYLGIVDNAVVHFHLFHTGYRRFIVFPCLECIDKQEQCTLSPTLRTSLK